MTDNPITPSPELKQQWVNEAPHQDYCSATNYAIDKAAQWGYEQRDVDIQDKLQKARDEELEACVEWMNYNCPNVGSHHLIAARRPKPKSLKEEALEALNQADKGLSESEWQQRSDIIRRALEQLDD